MHKDLFLNKTIPLPVRMNEYAKRIQPILTFGLEIQTVLNSSSKMLQIAENNHLRSMAALRKQEKETWKEYRTRSLTFARKAFHGLGHKSALT